MDLFADLAKRDAVNPFVQLLWDRGAVHEDKIVAGIKEVFVDLALNIESPPKSNCAPATGSA
jgi:hypothetical protein